MAMPDTHISTVGNGYVHTGNVAARDLCNQRTVERDASRMHSVARAC
jgi:hypothetical protein